MAFNIHVARVAIQSVNQMGNVVSKDDASISISEQLQTQMEHRIVADSSITNSVSSPTVKAYLEAEASDDFVLEYMDQNSVITYQRTAAGGYA
tara:strand:+ start:1122 stop:1400 length:279 start_codon:yes stop_codon:yes gene_type:complete